jgi:hypothetical protein
MASGKYRAMDIISVFSFINNYRISAGRDIYPSGNTLPINLYGLFNVCMLIFIGPFLFVKEYLTKTD